MTKKTKFVKVDIAAELRTEKDIAGYWDATVAEAAENKDPGMLLVGLGTVARARGLAQVAKQVGVTRAGLYKALRAGGHPDFSTVVNVLQVLGLKVTLPTAGTAPGLGRTSQR
jgi:probable addiction module antidote protein